MPSAKVLPLLALLGAASLAPAAARAAIDEASCAALAKSRVDPSVIGLPTTGVTVDSAVLANDPANGRMVRFMVVKDPGYDTLAFNPASQAAALQTLSRLIDASDPDISAFQKRGGKLLLIHGTVDMAVTPYNTIAYYERLKARFGDAALQQFVRFYVVPGFGHGDGTFQAGWDSLGELDTWVDRGIAPGPQTSRHRQGDPGADARAKAARTKRRASPAPSPERRGAEVQA